MKTFKDVLDENKGLGPGFDFLRIFLATFIVIFHALLYTDNPWLFTTPVWFIEYALVPMFFALSGFLITASGLRLSLKNFLINRGLRIVPALAVDIFICALIIGPIFTTKSLQEYFSDPLFRSYFLNIIGKVHYYLPGVFENHFNPKLNGALWTVPIEIGCYIIISFLILFRLLKSYTAVIILTLATLTASVFVAMPVSSHFLPPSLDVIANNWLLSRKGQVIIAFLFGIIFYQLRARIPYSGKLSIVLTALCILYAFVFQGPVGWNMGARFILLPTLTYITIYIGLTKIPLPRFFATGDYSYGVYLYHLPVLQVVIDKLPHMAQIPVLGGLLVFAIGYPFVFLLAIFSWHFIEKPILTLRKKFSFVARVRHVDSPEDKGGTTQKPNDSSQAAPAPIQISPGL